jgi:hypothetical protein
MSQTNSIKILFLTTCLFAANFLTAQNILIEGSITDSTLNKPLISATISLARAKDSSLISFTRTNEAGFFQLKNVAAGKYLLSISYVGYHPLWLACKVGSSAKLSLGKIYMVDTSIMANIDIIAKRPPVVINNDTIEFNSENFKTLPNAVVEDMLKKMPGIEVDKSGTITVNGKSVSKVFVNGKEFFTGDPKMATRNLPADAVDKIQVFDKKSDQSMFSGFDDGNEQTSINIKLKKDRNHSTFGKLNAATGTPSRWDAQGNINRLNDDEQMSVIAMANNTNRQGFSFGDIASFSGGGGGMRPGGGGGMMIVSGGGDAGGLAGMGGANSQGIANTYAGGGNYSNVFKNKNSDFNANISGSDIDRNITSKSFTQNLMPGNFFNQNSNSYTQSKDLQGKFGSTLDQKVSDKFSFKFTPNITTQHSNSSTISSASTFLPDGKIANTSQTSSSTESDAFNASGSLLLRKKFAKKGRTISSTITFGYNESTSNGYQLSNLKTYLNSIITKDSLMDQQNVRNGSSSNYSANLVYTEPLSKKSLLEFNSFVSKSDGASHKIVYDVNKLSGQYDLLNSRLTNEYESNFLYSGGGMNFRTNQKLFSFSSGVSLQNTQINGVNINTKVKVNQYVTDLLPAAMLQFNFSRTKNLNFNYRTSTSQPSLTQLQPILDLSNINNPYMGNPDLKRSYTHNLNLRFFSSKFISQKNFFAFLNASMSNNSIVNYDSILPNRTILTKPVNVNGVYRVNGNANYGFGLKKIHSRVNVGLNAGLNNNVSYSNGALNNIVIKSLGPSLTYNYQLSDVIDINLTTRYSYSITNNAKNPSFNTNFLTRVYSADITNYLPWGLVLNQSMNYTINSGRAAGYNTAIPIWNAFFSKFFLKNKRAELKFSAYDLLNKSTGIGRTVSQSQIIDQQYNVITQYFLIGITYSLQKSGLAGGTGARTFMMRMD